VIRSGKPVDREPALRYWRSRANRRVRKARLTRSVLRWSALATAHMALAGLLLYGGVRLFLTLASADEFSLASVEVEGARRVSTEEILVRLRPYAGRNILDLNLGEVAEVSARDPWALQASAKRVFPDTLRIRITERQPGAIAVIDGVAHVIDTEGYVIRPSGPGATDDLPVLTGLDGMNEEELIAALRRGVTLVARLRRVVPGWVGEISELELSRGDRVAVRTVDPGPTLLLDPARIERNLPEYLELRRDVARRVGAMKYVDLRWEDHISVMPAKSIPLKEGS